MHAKVSPDEEKAGYVYENNIYVKNLRSNETKQLTFDGSENIINGQFDWVYEEEFGQTDGWRWSPDSKKIAFWRMDQTNVLEFSWAEYDGEYGEIKSVRYPKAGETNSIVKIGVYHLDSGKTVWIDIGEETDIYIPRIQWTNDPNKLSIQRLNRLQNKLELLMADAASGESEAILTETDPCWIDIGDDLNFLEKNDQFIWTSEKDGYKHIYLYNTDGELVKQLTKGKWEVSRVYGLDEKNNTVFFNANKGNMAESHVFRADLNGDNLTRLSQVPGYHSANFAPDYSAFIHSWSNFKTPSQTALADGYGKLIRKLVENTLESFEDYKLAYPELMSFYTSDGVEIKAMITKPVDFDPNKKYPVLIYGYSGPGSQLVRNSWGRATSKLWYTMLTQKGYIIFTLDNRGTGGRGKAFKNLAYGDIGKFATKDHIEGAKYLASLPYVDKDRIGVWGWSGGGYLTLMAMTKGSKYFKAGIAVAPVSDFRLYDSIWTERYMGLPHTNAAGYDSSSVLSHADQYQGGLLVVHGGSDDNVHVQNSMQFIKALQDHGKQFEMLLYPGRNHSLRGGKNIFLHLYTKMTNFILNNL